MPDYHLLSIALLTIGIELPIFWLYGYRNYKELLAFGLVNLISNLLLNETLSDYNSPAYYWIALFIGEVLVVLLEFALMLYVIKDNKKTLLKAICITNSFSLLIGLLIMFMVKGNYVGLL